VILMQKMQNFSGEGAQPPPPQWGGAHPLPTPYPPRRLDLNPPILKFCLRYCPWPPLPWSHHCVRIPQRTAP